MKILNLICATLASSALLVACGGGSTLSGSQPHGRGPQSGVKTWPLLTVRYGTTARVTGRPAPSTS